MDLVPVQWALRKNDQALADIIRRYAALELAQAARQERQTLLDRLTNIDSETNPQSASMPTSKKPSKTKPNDTRSLVDRYLDDEEEVASTTPKVSEPQLVEYLLPESPVLNKGEYCVIL